MGRLYAEAQKKMRIEAADEILSYLDQVKDTDNWKDLLIGKLDAMIADYDAQIHKGNKGHAWDFSKEKALPTFTSDGDILLRPFRESDKHFYYAVWKQWNPNATSSLLSEDDNFLWNEATADYGFYCVVEWHGTPVGYVSIHDTRVGVWEFGIELDREYCYKGLGPKSIKLFLQTIEEITLISLYRARVEVDNLACQKCMAKIGAELVGLCDGPFKTAEEKKQFEDEHIDRIDDHMRGLAIQLSVEPRELLSHVLEYEIQV